MAANDTRGWIMTAAAGIACVVGASFVCIDKVIRLFPGQRKFKIEDNNSFLSSSLSLSFGVMLFSALYNMLPSAKASLETGGFSTKVASWALIGLFLAGVVGIQIASRILHHYMPSHVVDCDHSHEEEEAHPNGHHLHHTENGHSRHTHPSEHTPLVPTKRDPPPPTRNMSDSASASWGQEAAPGLLRRPSLQFLSNPSHDCDDHGQCLGFSNPCHPDCFQTVQARGGSKLPRHGGLARTVSSPLTTHFPGGRSGNLPGVDEERPLLTADESDDSHRPSPTPSKAESVVGNSHHHHVPTNAFLSIGLQTSLAIALHKLPEGFITYATNHANPQLGVSVFLALFIHNITEGFAMALPLYLALGSRLKAILWSVVLGGASQPLGAGIAALWLKLAGSGASGDMGEGVYGGMFAVIAGIMTSVALQLFSESLELSHSRDLCMVFAFVGMSILGASSALTQS